MIPTPHLVPSELLPTLRPMISKGAVLQAHDASRHLVVADTRAQVARLKRVVAELDNPEGGRIEVIPLVHLSPAQVVEVAEKVLHDARPDFALVVDSRANRLLASGDPAARARLRELVRALDVPAEAGGVAVLRLAYARAEEVKPLLEGLLASAPFAGQAPQEGQPGGVGIEVDAGNNALLIAGDPATVARLRRLVEEIDVPRRQVLIEAVVAEIAEDQARDLTVQLAAAGREGGAIINFNQLLPALLGLGLEDELTSEDLARLPLRGGLTAGGADVDGERRGIGLLVEALESDGDAQILSTPSVVTLDNEQATISVGQEVPFITGSYTTANNVLGNPFQTIQREEVGIKLKVRPQIAEGRTVRLAIEQETSNLLEATPEQIGTADKVTAKRLIATDVLVGDGEFLVLGGLIDHARQGRDARVPLLGRLPVIGGLFGSRSRSRQQSVLMVFIRPTILDGPAERRQVTAERYRVLRALRGDDPEGVALPERLDALPEGSGAP
ncbi:MAG: hypothetical protein KatS3mg124_1444 [Porticoccaceae bacterium]|nr:MAG: hypothetical protein KatS3mg124_1444 [Porticoccaceae bacterium]